MNFRIKLTIVFLLTIPFCVFAQNQKINYASKFAQLQNELREEVGVENLTTIELNNNTMNTKPYSLQIIGISNYNLFVKNEDLYTNIRILYLDNIDFSKVDVMSFNRIKKLKAIRFKNCRNIDFEDLVINLSKTSSIQQIHFNEINFNNWQLDFNSINNLKVITFDYCFVKCFSEIELSLEEFTVNRSRNIIDLNDVKIEKVKTINITESIVKEFPFTLSNVQNLEYLSFYGTKIRKKLSKDISGFENLIYLDITNSKINFNNKTFLDAKKLFIINGSEVSYRISPSCRTNTTAARLYFYQ